MNETDIIITKAEKSLEALKEAKEELKGFIRRAQQELQAVKSDNKAASLMLTTKQAAEILGVDKRTVYRWKREGRLSSTSLKDVYNCKFRKNKK